MAQLNSPPDSSGTNRGIYFTPGDGDTPEHPPSSARATNEGTPSGVYDLAGSSNVYTVRTETSHRTKNENRGKNVGWTMVSKFQTTITIL